MDTVASVSASLDCGSCGKYPANVCWLAIKEVWHEYLIWTFLVTVGKDIGALQGLWEEAKDVVLFTGQLLSITGGRMNIPRQARPA